MPCAIQSKARRQRLRAGMTAPDAAGEVGEQRKATSTASNPISTPTSPGHNVQPNRSKRRALMSSSRAWCPFQRSHGRA
jgi:hypothetical protein